LDHIRDPDAIVSDHVLKNRSNFGHLPMQFLRCVLGRRGYAKYPSPSSTVSTSGHDQLRGRCVVAGVRGVVLAAPRARLRRRACAGRSFTRRRQIAHPGQTT
jgi:hypothetical protein